MFGRFWYYLYMLIIVNLLLSLLVYNILHYIPASLIAPFDITEPVDVQ